MTFRANSGPSHDAGREKVRGLARLIIGAGACTSIGGAVAWMTVRSQLATERITIPASSQWLPGRAVRGPIGAFAEAEAIKTTALHATGGKTYSEIEGDDPQADMARDASLLRSSLFTSVLAFGVAAGAIVIGVALVLVGTALSRLSRGRGVA
ncbi:MAG TPA: aromatic ring-opening dioxygenase LigA [Propionibacteriaceae bacterium]|nr:aromatic ring-opening dioxygenase LigA [Propionibacteriaceae bacterium]